MSVNTEAPDFGNVFAATALVILPLAALAPLAIAWVPGLSALWIAIIYLRCGRRPWEGRSWLIPIVLAGLIAYGAVTLIWSISPDRTLRTVIKLIPIVIGGWLLIGAAAQLDERARQRSSTALLIGGVFAFVVIGIEIATGGLIQGLLRGQGFEATGRLIHLNRAASLVAIMIWPVWLILDRRFGPFVAAAAIGVTALTLFGLDPDTPLLAVFTGALFLPLAYLVPRFARALMIAGVVVVALAIPLYPAILPTIDSTLLSWDLGDFTLRHRLAIWDFAATRTMEQPILGWGLGASRAVPGADAIFEQLSSRAEALPLHPHNALLQLWLELGIPGIVLALIAVVTILAKITRIISGRKELAAALTVILSATMIAELSYGIWQTWWLVFLWVIAALTIAIAGGPARAEPA
jgi:O-antigen ligase